jgi:hypothetical protein
MEMLTQLDQKRFKEPRMPRAHHRSPKRLPRLARSCVCRDRKGSLIHRTAVYGPVCTVVCGGVKNEPYLIGGPLFMPASSEFKGSPLQTSPKVHSEPKGLFPAVTNTPRLATSAPFSKAEQSKRRAVQTRMPGRGCARRCRRFERRRSQARDHRSTSTPTRLWKRAPTRHARAAVLSKEAAMNMTTMRVITERTQWAARISAAWQKGVDSIIDTGHLLLAAKADPKMQHGEWGTMVESDLLFNRHTAHKLMQIAGDKRLTNVSQGKHLPPS